MDAGYERVGDVAQKIVIAIQVASHPLRQPGESAEGVRRDDGHGAERKETDHGANLDP